MAAAEGEATVAAVAAAVVAVAAAAKVAAEPTALGTGTTRLVAATRRTHLTTTPTVTEATTMLMTMGASVSDARFISREQFIDMYFVRQTTTPRAGTATTRRRRNKCAMLAERLW